MNIREELTELYATAKTAGKLDLAFRILACLAKMKPDVVSVEMLSSNQLTSIITECGVLTPETTLDSQPSGNDSEERGNDSEERGSGNEERENDSNKTPRPSRMSTFKRKHSRVDPNRGHRHAPFHVS